jgi:hypothetical protein
MRLRTTIPALALTALALGAPAAQADSERLRVCAEQLELNREPNQGWHGDLREGESIRVRKYSDSGKYAYGFAYGDINRVGWVLSDGLCGRERARTATAARLVGDRVPVRAERLELNREPNEGWDGELRRGQTFDVRKLSDSGKYAYGFAYGDINRVGWVLTAGLTSGQ